LFPFGSSSPLPFLLVFVYFYKFNKSVYGTCFCFYLNVFNFFKLFLKNNLLFNSMHREKKEFIRKHIENKPLLLANNPPKKESVIITTTKSVKETLSDYAIHDSKRQSKTSQSPSQSQIPSSQSNPYLSNQQQQQSDDNTNQNDTSIERNNPYKSSKRRNKRVDTYNHSKSNKYSDRSSSSVRKPVIAGNIVSEIGSPRNLADNTDTTNAELKMSHSYDPSYRRMSRR
jgi:hypothetical protein